MAWIAFESAMFCRVKWVKYEASKKSMVLGMWGVCVCVWSVGVGDVRYGCVRGALVLGVCVEYWLCECRALVLGVCVYMCVEYWLCVWGLCAECWCWVCVWSIGCVSAERWCWARELCTGLTSLPRRRRRCWPPRPASGSPLGLEHRPSAPRCPGWCPPGTGPPCPDAPSLPGQVTQRSHRGSHRGHTQHRCGT